MSEPDLVVIPARKGKAARVRQGRVVRVVKTHGVGHLPTQVHFAIEG